MSTARKVNRSESVLIKTQNEVDCEASKSTSFRWEIFNISDDPVNYRSIVSSVPVKTSDQPYYNLAAKSLGFGFYKLHFTLTMEGVVGISGSADGFIHVVATRGDSLKAVINGGSRKRYKFGTMVSLVKTIRQGWIAKNEGRAAHVRGMTLILARILPCAFHSSRASPIIRLGRAWAKNGSSSDNPSVYKYEQADGSSIHTSYRDSPSFETNHHV